LYLRDHRDHCGSAPRGLRVSLAPTRKKCDYLSAFAFLPGRWHFAAQSLKSALSDRAYCAGTGVAPAHRTFSGATAPPRLGQYTGSDPTAIRAVAHVALTLFGVVLDLCYPRNRAATLYDRHHLQSRMTVDNARESDLQRTYGTRQDRLSILSLSPRTKKAP